MLFSRSFREYSVAAVQPKIIDPSVLYIDLTSFVYFNPNVTRRSQEEVKNVVLASLTTLNSSGEFNKFGGKFKFSKLGKIIDDSELSITSNITRLKMRKNVTVTLDARVNYKVCYGNRIKKQMTSPSVSTSGFKIAGDVENTYYLQDDGNGLLKLFYVKQTGGFEFIDGLWGTVDYDNGDVVINDLVISSTSIVNNQLQIFGIPESNDLISLRETYLTLGLDNTVVNVVEDTITSGSNISGTGVVPESSYKLKRRMAVSSWKIGQWTTPTTQVSVPPVPSEVSPESRSQISHNIAGQFPALLGESMTRLLSL